MIVRNPYAKRSAILSSDDFFGREQELRDIYTRVIGGQSVSLVGERRVGKSSILNALRFEEMREQYGIPDHILFAHIDLQYIADCTEQALLDYLIGQVSELTTVGDLPVRRHSLRQIGWTLRARGQKLAILMDEFDVLLANRNIPADLFAFLRAWSSENAFPYVIASREGSIDSLASDPTPGSAFLNIFGTVYVGPFTQDEAKSLVVTPSSNAGLPFERAEVEAALRLAGRFPLFLQIVCYFMFDRKMTGESNVGDSDEVLRRFCYEATPHFRYLESRLSDRARAALERFVSTRDPGPDAGALAELVRKGVLIDDNGTRRVFSTLFEEMIRSAHHVSDPSAGRLLALLSRG